MISTSFECVHADSTVLAHVMTTLNERYNYGLDLFLLAVDEGIVVSLSETVLHNRHSS